MNVRTTHAAVLAATLLCLPLAAGSAAADSDTGRQLVGVNCSNPMAMPKPGACVALSFDSSTAHGYTDSPDRTLAIRPGTYWLTVTDKSTAHNFELESPDLVDEEITGVAATPGAVTIKVNLKPGHWVLFCDPHRDMGMYVDIEVGGVGQVG